MKTKRILSVLLTALLVANSIVLSANAAEATVSSNDVTAVDEYVIEESDEISEILDLHNEYFKLDEELLEEKHESKDHLFETLPAGDDAYVEGEVIYYTESEEDAKNAALVYGGTLESYSYDLAVIKLPEEIDVETAVSICSEDTNNLPVVAPNHFRYLDAEDPYLVKSSGKAKQWYHDYIGDKEAWDAGYTGSGVKVAVIDTGINIGHEDLGSNIKSVYNFSQGKSVAGYNKDTNGHGTHVTGIIAAARNNGKGGTGIAYNAEVTGYALSDASNPGLETEDIIRAINAARSNGAMLINMSLGGGYYNSQERIAIQSCYSAGIAVFCSAGNSAASVCEYPAGYLEAIAVAAMDETGALSCFSCSGKRVDLVFPGERIFSTYNASTSSYYLMNGTSQACPMAVGTAAALISKNNSWYTSKTGGDRVEALRTVMKKYSKKCTTSGVNAGCTYLPDAIDATAGSDVAHSARDVVSQLNIKVNGETVTGLAGKVVEKNIEATSATVLVVNPAYNSGNTSIYYGINKKPSVSQGKVKNGTLCTGSFTLTDKVNTITIVAINNMSGAVSPYFTFKVNTPNIVTSTSGTIKITGEKIAWDSAASRTATTEDYHVAIGKGIALKAEITPAVYAKSKVNWTVTDTAGNAVEGVTVKNGKFATTKNAKPGLYKVSASAEQLASGNLAVAYVRVYDSAISKLTVTSSIGDTKGINLFTTSGSAGVANTSATITAVVEGVSASTHAVNISSANPEIADVVRTSAGEPKYSVSGAVTRVSVAAKAPGSTTITVKTTDGSNKKFSIKVNVGVPSSYIEVASPTEASGGSDGTANYILAAGCKVKLNTRWGEDYGKVTNKTLTWTSSNTDVVTVDKSGTIAANKTAVGNTATITAKAADGSSDTIIITVKPLYTKLYISYDGNYDELFVYGYYKNGNSVTYGEPTYLKFDVKGQNGDDSFYTTQTGGFNLVPGRQTYRTGKWYYGTVRASFLKKYAHKISCKATVNDGSKKSVSRSLYVVRDAQDDLIYYK